MLPCGSLRLGHRWHAEGSLVLLRWLFGFGCLSLNLAEVVLLLEGKGGMEWGGGEVPDWLLSSPPTFSGLEVCIGLESVKNPGLSHRRADCICGRWPYTVSTIAGCTQWVYSLRHIHTLKSKTMLKVIDQVL